MLRRAQRQFALPLLLGAALLLGLAASPARAQEWQEYSYPDQGVAFQLPAAPSVKDGTAATPTGVTAPVKTWRAEGKGIVYTLQIFDLSKTQANAATIIAETEKALIGSGQVATAVDSRINRQFGRELTINAADGSRLTVALFYINQHLYQLMAKALPPDPADRSAQAIHFQQSLQFVGQNGQGFGGGFGGGPGGGFGGRGRFGPGGGGGGPAAQAACTGKAAGDKVSFQTPDGQTTTATCVLVARPDRPPGGGPGGRGGPPPP
jgi:uncharacterized membrane protein YgcG